MYFRSVPVLRYLLLLCVGIYLSDSIQLSSPLLLLLITIVFLFGIFSSKIYKFNFLRHFVPLIFLLFGFLTVNIFNDKNEEDHITHKGDFDNYIAVIDSYTESKPKSYKVTAQIFAVKKEEKWEKASGETLLYFNKTANVFPKFGEIYVLKNTLREIEPPKNPFEFDYKLYQARKNIFTHQFLREGDYVKAGETKLNPIFYYANQMNVYTHTVFKSILDTPKQLGVAEALIGGMKSELDFETKQWYSATGAIHALAVSGMHVAILFIVLNTVLGLFLNKKKPAFLIIILLLLWIYAVFTGLSPSVCRSTLMFSMIQFGQYLRRDDNPVNTLLLSALILLSFFPMWLYDVGFQLSYLAVLGILILYPKLRFMFEIPFRPLRWIWEISAVSIAAQVFTLPLTLYYFHQFPNYFLIANPIVSIISTVLLPLGLVVLFFFKIPILGSFLGLIFKWSIDVLNYSVQVISSWPKALSTGLSISEVSVILLFCIIAFVLIFLKNKNIFYLKLTALIVVFLSLQGIYNVFVQNKQKEITFHFIPNGWGVSVVEGRNVTFISTDSLCNEPLIYQFHLKNYYDAKGISEFKTEVIPDEGNALVSSKLTEVQWVKTPNGELLNPDCKFVLCSDNSIKNLDAFKDYGGHIIIDGSNKKWVVEKLKEEAIQKKKKLVVLYDTGSRTFKF